jgi:hypothetical protein
MRPTQANQLAKKLLIKTAQRWLFVRAQKHFPESFAPLAIEINTTISADETFNGILLFLKNSAELNSALPEIILVLKLGTIFRIAYPKKSSGIASDLEMTANWTEIEKYHLKIVSAASIDKTWTALRLRPVEQVKTSTISNAAIQNNELAVFIDTKKQNCNAAGRCKSCVKIEPKVFETYQKLAYSHQKEYIIWILSAKQEKTWTNRVQKIIEKLTDQ